MKVVVLGATGSIGQQTLEVADHLGLEVVGLAAHTGGRPFASLAHRYPDAQLALEEPPSGDLADEIGRPIGAGSAAVAALAAMPDVVVVNGIVGVAGLASSVAAVEAGNRLALANKETLVAAGALVSGIAHRTGAEIIPVDSEHSALHQCLAGERHEDVGRIILTASGGPFVGWSPDRLAGVTPEQALQHPTWNMGVRITTDSATLANKGLEVIEAHVLFGLAYDAIDVVVHRQSIVHSLVEFVDGSLKAHLGAPDMRIPIQYALTYPGRQTAPATAFSLTHADLTFESPDLEAFPALRIAYEAGRQGGMAPCAYNAADEVAVQAFHAGRIGFMDIPRIIETAVSAAVLQEPESIDQVISADTDARQAAEDTIRSL